MPLPALDQWNETRDSLQRAAQVLGAIRTSVVAPLPNALRRSLDPVPYGLSAKCPPIGELRLVYAERAVTLHPAGGEQSMIFLKGHDQTSLMDTLLEALATTGHHPTPERTDLNSTTFIIDKALAADYAHVQDRMFTTLARFRARLLGPMTPLVIWPHHFDMAFLWFSTPDVDDHKNPHMGIGFAPYSDGIDHPYFYAYCWPLPDGLIGTPIPEGTEWNTEGWRGVRLDYARFMNMDDPETFIETTLVRVHDIIAAAMRGG